MTEAQWEEIYDLIPPQHKDDKFVNWIRAWTTKVLDAYIDISSYFNVDDAVGAQLDIIGEYVGVSRKLNFNPTSTDTTGLIPGTRNMLDDDLYRTVIYAQIARNNWDGTLPNVIELWELLLPERFIAVLDHLDMSMNLLVYGTASDLEREMVQKFYFVPKPSGVLVNYIFPSDFPLFGYDRDDTQVKGYDGGMWAISYEPEIPPDVPYFGWDRNDIYISGYDVGEYN